MSDEMDGRFYAQGRRVYRAPRTRPFTNGGQRITMGFRVCELDEGATDDCATAIAMGLNRLIDSGEIENDLSPIEGEACAGRAA